MLPPNGIREAKIEKKSFSRQNSWIQAVRLHKKVFILFWRPKWEKAYPLLTPKQD